MPKEPRPYKLAATALPDLLRKYNHVQSTLSGDGALTRLKTFEDLIQRGCPSINMTIPGCIRFLESGRWLNVYEAVALKVGVSYGSAFESALREKLGVWYEPRTTLDRLMGFRKDTHYAALNIGGCGPDYGECCVRFGTSAPLVFATCFAGDTLQVVFDENAAPVLSREEILGRFSTYLHRATLAAVHHHRFLAQSAIIDKDVLVNMLDDRETLIEVHIHGAVRREHAVEIALRSESFSSLARRCIEYENAPTHAREAKQFTKVRLLKRLLQLTDRYGLKVQGKR